MALGKNIKTRREQLKLTQPQLAALSGVDIGTISALEVRDSTRSKYAAELARALGTKLEDLMESTVTESRDAPPPAYGQAQVLSHQTVTVTPEISWESLVNAPLPPKFDVIVPDDSMSPRVRAGQAVTFSTTETARPGDGVLVQDQDGNVYFRIYRQRRADSWQAHPLSDAYQALDSERDGLTVLAVLVGVPARWG